MASGIQTLYNYNSGAYSATGYPFSNGHLKLQMAWSSVADAANNRSAVTVTVSVYHYGLSIGAKTLTIKWNGAAVATLTAAAINNTTVKAQTHTLGSATFNVSHGSDGHLTGTLTAEWSNLSLSYTSGGVTKSISELGCQCSATMDSIPRNPPVITAKAATLGGGVTVSGTTKYIPNKSYVDLSMTATIDSGRTVKYRFSYIFNGVTTQIYDGTSNSIRFVPTQAGTYQFKFTAYDASNGAISASETYGSMTVVSYVAPAGNLDSTVSIRCNSGGTEATEGTYAKCTPVYTAGKVGGTAISTTCSVKVNGYTASNVASGSSVVLGNGSLNIANKYIVTYTLTDGVSTVTFYDTISVAFFTMDFANGGKGVAAGREAVDGYFDIANMVLRLDRASAITNIKLNPTANSTPLALVEAFCGLVANNLGYATYTAAASWVNHSNGYSIYAVAPQYGSGYFYRISGVLQDFPNGVYHFTDNYNSDAGTHNIKMSALIPWA